MSDEEGLQSEAAAAPPTDELDEDVFEDARADNQGKMVVVDLEQSLRDCDEALCRFFKNDITGAMEILKPWSHVSLYHSLGAAILEFIPAVLTFDTNQISLAVNAINLCISVCNKNRKQFTFVQTLSSIMRKRDYAAYTDLEAHAELCYAEAQLLQAVLNVLEGEDLTGLIKGTFKVKNCYNLYQDCLDINVQKRWDCAESKIHFKSGVRLGTATFNLMISLLPPKIVTLLEFVGFTGNKAYGLSELEKGGRAAGIRAVLCDMTILIYHLVICQYTGGEGDLSIAEKILHKSLAKYPNSVWFLVFKARLELVHGLIEDSINTYTEDILCTRTFKYFRQLCFWELMWLNGLKLDFRNSALFAELVVVSSSWSKTTHTYIHGAMLLQIGDDIKSSEIETVNELFRSAPRYRSRIAGKSLPMEKFVIKRCARYQAQGGRLILPGIEMLCLWSMLPMLNKNKPILQNVLKMIERTSNILETTNQDWMRGYEADNKALLLYLNGCCYSAMDLPLQAIEMLKQVFRYKKDIKEDTFLLPFTTYEIGVCYYIMGQYTHARTLFTEAKKKYSGYSLESRLHFRIHTRLDMLKNRVGNVKFIRSSPPIAR